MKNKIKKIATSIFLVSISGLLGYFIAWFIISFLSGDTSSNDKEIDYGLLALCVLLALFWLFASFLMHTVFHEGGHLVFGRLTGYKFLSFRIFNLMIIKAQEGFELKRQNVMGTLGQCLMIPPSCSSSNGKPDYSTLPYFWYNAGGVLVNLSLSIVCLVVFFCIDCHNPFTVGFLLMFPVVGIYFSIVNGVPMVVGSIPNDAMNILTIYKNPARKRDFHNMFFLAYELSKGTRLSQMDDGLFPDESVDAKADIFQISTRNNYMERLLDKGDYVGAKTIALEILSLGTRLSGIIYNEVASEYVLLELMTTNDLQVIGKYWDKKLQMYVKAYSRYSPMKSAVMFAYSYICLQDKDDAMRHLDYINEHKSSYPMAGELQSALAVIDYIKNI